METKRDFIPGIADGRCFVGIWERIVNNNNEILYKRDPKKSGEWHHWANVQVLRPKGQKKRVLLFGESAARGFLYDPAYNFAKELEGIFAGMPGLPAAEIVDLAKVGITLDELLALIKASAILEPDALVILAGNNWSHKLKEQTFSFETLFEMFREKPIREIKQYFEDQLKPLVEDFMRSVPTFFSKRIPIIFVIPEFNLGDWKSNEAERILPWAPDDRIKNWLHAEQAAQNALSKDEIRKVEENAHQMTILDPSNPLGFELLAACYLKKGQLTAARKCFEMSRDTMVFSRAGNSTPRCISVVRDTILKEAPGNGIAIVDLPEIFATELPDRIPDRYLFLDYCHLTVEGIKIAARHIAQKLISRLSGIPVRVKDIRDSTVRPSDEHLSVAHLSAAIYNAHHGQPREIVEYHCKKAMDKHPAIKDTMIKYADFATRKTPTHFCKSFEELIMSGKMGPYEGGFCLLHPRGGKLMDYMLVESILRCIDPAEAKMNSAIDELRIVEHGTDPDHVDLLESFYSESSYNGFAAIEKTVYFQARSAKSRFHFVAKGDTPLIVRMTFRTPGRDYPNERIKVLINGQTEEVAILPMSKTWFTGSLRLERYRLIRGVNELSVLWPYSSEPMNMEGVFSRDSFLKSIFPVLGEIYHLDLAVAGDE